MDKNQITIIGAANIDIHGFSFEEIMPKESNPGRVKFCLGGVGRNISENLARAGMKVRLISSIGDDSNSKWLLDSCTEIGIDISETIIHKGSNASIYLDIMNSNGDMEIAVSDLLALEMMTPQHLIEKHQLIDNSRVIVLDTGVSEDVIFHVLENYGHIPIFIDPVSSPKAKKIKNRLYGIHTLKLNKLEAGFLADIKITNKTSLEEAAKVILSQGVKRVFITLGGEGVYYKEGDYANSFKVEAAKIINTTGSGDAFMAGVVYSLIKDFDLDYTAKIATAFSLITLADENTVSPGISEMNIMDIAGKM
ncbi:MAG: PfkB family carbohydrate kinase [Eubacteriales bacterium]